jgi:hypothetical protein
MQTPAELSTLKAEREAQFREKQEAMTRKMIEQQHAAQLQRKLANGQPNQQQPLPTAQQIRNVSVTQAAAAQAQVAQAVAQPRIAANGIPNGSMGTAVMAGMSAQQIQVLQQAGRLPAAVNGDMSRLAAIQQHRQLAALQQQAQLANPGLAAQMSGAANGMSAAQAQQQLLAQLQVQQQQRNLAAMNAVNGVNGSPNPNAGTIAANAAQQSQMAASTAMLGLIQQIQRQFPQYTVDQVRALANEKMKQRMSQSALTAATGMSPASVLQQQAAVAQQQHHQHNQQALAAAFAAAQSTMGMPGQLGVGQGGSPTPLYRAMQIAAQQQMQGQAQGASPQVARLGSGSPALQAARPDSRGGMAQGMVRSVSGKGGSPVNMR